MERLLNVQISFEKGVDADVASLCFLEASDDVLNESETSCARKPWEASAHAV